ncbi:MAG: DUF2905 domain-containing protein [Nitrospira sp.]|nr:DUF2905 domain-containing protein [Candidatus Manganitrophaceae bacterium]HIL34063.1 DUF2905 domain-containing protein [Candidatus Manganitrophaceae bacterium]
MFDIGRSLILFGILLSLIGGLLLLFAKVPGIGKLPGDILIQRKNFSFYFPWITCLLISLILSLFFWFIKK